jgi:hypothetical protein
MRAIRLELQDAGTQHDMRRFKGQGHWWHLSLDMWRDLGEPSSVLITIEVGTEPIDSGYVSHAEGVTERYIVEAGDAKFGEQSDSQLHD